MHAGIAVLVAVSLAGVVGWPGLGGKARAETRHTVPKSVVSDHESVMAYLRKIAARPTPEGPAAQKVIDLLVPHMAKEEALILPPLVLLPVLATGKVTPDMRWAIEMADRVKAEQAELLNIH